MYLYIHLSIHTNIYPYIHVCLLIHIYIYIPKCIHVHTRSKEPVYTLKRFDIQPNEKYIPSNFTCTHRRAYETGSDTYTDTDTNTDTNTNIDTDTDMDTI